MEVEQELEQGDMCSESIVDLPQCRCEKARLMLNGAIVFAVDRVSKTEENNLG